MDGHWSETFERDSITPENREAFVAQNRKYATQQDAVVGGYNASKITGKPFKMPESLDKLPDDASRSEFKAQARGVLGINIPKDVESMKDLNFKSGLAEGAVVNDDFVGLVKNWAVESGIDTATIEKLSAFYNGPLAKFAQEASAKAQEDKKVADAEKCDQSLIEHFKSEEKVKELSVLMNRAIIGNMGLSAEESAEFVDAMADSILTKNPVMARGMLNLLSSVSVEGTTHTGDGSGGTGAVKQASPYEMKKARWPKSESNWGAENDTWDSQTVETKRIFGYKEVN